MLIRTPGSPHSERILVATTAISAEFVVSASYKKALEAIMIRNVVLIFLGRNLPEYSAAANLKRARRGAKAWSRFPYRKGSK
jgi:hypothetical protein